jgi:hypothetical protein
LIQEPVALETFRLILLPASEAEELVDPSRREATGRGRTACQPHLTLAGPLPSSSPLPRNALGALATEIRGQRIDC